MPTMVNHERKWIFVHVPKTGGSSLYYALRDLFDLEECRGKQPHRGLKDLGFDYSGYFKFCVARNPWEMVVSWMAWHWKYGAKASIETAVYLVQPQSWFGLEEMDYVLRFERLRSDFIELCDRLGIQRRKLLGFNRSKHFCYRHYFTEAQRETVAQRFAREIELFGYQFEEQGRMRIETKGAGGVPNGYLVTIWNSLEDDWKPAQVYLTVVNPGCQKGPHLHKKRIGRFICISGNVKVILKYGWGYVHLHSGEDNGYPLIEVPAGIPSALVNESDQPAFVLNLPTPAWSQSNQDEWPVEDWKPE